MCVSVLRLFEVIIMCIVLLCCVVCYLLFVFVVGCIVFRSVTFDCDDVCLFVLCLIVFVVSQ